MRMIIQKLQRVRKHAYRPLGRRSIAQRQFVHACHHNTASATFAYSTDKNECVPSTTLFLSFIAFKYRRTASAYFASPKICPARISVKIVPDPVSVYGSSDLPSTYQ